MWACGHVGKCGYMGGGAGWFVYVVGAVELSFEVLIVQRRTPILASISSALCIHTYTYLHPNADTKAAPTRNGNHIFIMQTLRHTSL